jgi:hypothetical protein
LSAIPILLCHEAYTSGFKHWINLDYKKGSPHVITAGRTGSGKTVLSKLILGRTILFAPKELQPIEVMIIDPKADTDFDFLDVEGITNFYRGEMSVIGIEAAFSRFRQRQSKDDASRNLILIFIDEFASLVNFVQDRKEKEEIYRKLSLLLMLSRSYMFSIQMATQQPSAQTLGNSGNREQMGTVCLLGDSGVETQRMLFDGDSIERIKEYGHIGGRSVGWLSKNGSIAQPVRVPKVTKWDKLHTVIREGVEKCGK